MNENKPPLIRNPRKEFKPCIDCGLVNNHGKGNRCKVCYSKDYYKRNREHIIKKTYETKSLNKWYYNEHTREKGRVFSQLPEQKAKNKVRNASRYLIPKQGICVCCGEKANTEFHHTEYKVEAVIEVCKKCHSKQHNNH